jgi:hypothetical protein
LGRAIVDVDKGDLDKRIAIHPTAAGGHAEVLRLLCETAKAIVNIKNRWGHRPLDYAIGPGQVCDNFGAQRGRARQCGRRDALLGKEALYDLMHKHGRIRNGSDGEQSM